MTLQRRVERRQVHPNQLSPPPHQLTELVTARAGRRERRLRRRVIGIVLRVQFERKLAVQINKTPCCRPRLPHFAGILQ